MNDDEGRLLAERIREACISAAQDGYEDASMAGLCGEGALEVAISAMRRLALDDLVAAADAADANGPDKAP